MRKHTFSTLIVVIFTLLILVGCGTPAETGRLTFRANGEDFVREGFVSKDGWAIQFDHVYVTLAEITAYQTDPPFDPHSGGEIAAATQVALPGPITVDLAEGDEEADPIFVGELTDAPAGRYNALSWNMVPNSAGYPLVMVGTAVKDAETIEFTIQIETPFRYACGDYVGDERKGILAANGAADLELTFHFDHIFGDGEAAPDDEINLGAPGFAPFAAAAANGRLTANLASLQTALNPADFQMLVDILPSLGHVGEGHCHSETP